MVCEEEYLRWRDTADTYKEYARHLEEAYASGDRRSIENASRVLESLYQMRRETEREFEKCVRSHGRGAEADALLEHARQLEADFDLLKERLGDSGRTA